MIERKAIAVHHTATSNGDWDGPANEARLKTSMDASYYSKAYAWRDPDGDETVKASYKFIHHEVSADGTPGAANLTACSTGIGILNGGRGGTTIPDADKQGVWQHLAAHITDAGSEPPELKSYRRVYPAEVRSTQDGKPEIEFYAAVFDSVTSIGGFFDEVVRRGAFENTLKSRDQVALWDHDSSRPLGRKSAGTLLLEEDSKGLHAVIWPDMSISWQQDAYNSVKRGDVKGASFGFEIIQERWDPQKRLAELLEVDLWEVSLCTFPAYAATEAQVRMYGMQRACAAGKDIARLRWMDKCAAELDAELKDPGYRLNHLK
jgi:HK97 family phage prohead protease